MAPKIVWKLPKNATQQLGRPSPPPLHNCFLCSRRVHPHSFTCRYVPSMIRAVSLKNRGVARPPQEIYNRHSHSN